MKSPQIATKEIVVQPKPDGISWSAITELLHEAFAEHSRNGLVYSASTQSDEHTRKRVGNGVCLVAMYNNKLVGTATFHIQNKLIHIGQVAVHPNYRKFGIGLKLQYYIFEFARRNRINALICDTSEKAVRVVKWYLKQGWQKVGVCSHKTTNFYSIVLRRQVCGKKYSKLEAKCRFYLSWIYCHIKTDEYGEMRRIAKPIYKIYKILNR